MVRKQTLEEWIDEALIDGDKPGPIEAIALMHMTGTAEKELHAIVLGTGKQWTAVDLAQLFQRKAQSFAQDLPGAQTFCLVAKYEKEVDPTARHPFVIAPIQSDFNGLTTEAPDTKGVTQQSMRHLEVRMQMSDRMIMHATETVMGMNSMLAKENRDLREETQQAYKALREMYLGQLREEHEIKLKEQKMQREDELLSKLIEFGPLLLNSITGKEIIPIPKADSIMIDALAKAATPELVTQLAQSLPPEIVGAFMHRLQEAAEARQNAEEVAAKKLMEHPEEDAGGGKE